MGEREVEREREREREVTVCVAFRRSHPAVSHLNTSVEQAFDYYRPTFININPEHAVMNTHILIPTGSYQ